MEEHLPPNWIWTSSGCVVKRRKLSPISLALTKCSCRKNKSSAIIKWPLVWLEVNKKWYSNKLEKVNKNYQVKILRDFNTKTGHNLEFTQTYILIINSLAVTGDHKIKVKKKSPNPTNTLNTRLKLPKYVEHSGDYYSSYHWGLYNQS